MLTATGNWLIQSPNSGLEKHKSLSWERKLGQGPPTQPKSSFLYLLSHCQASSGVLRVRLDNDDKEDDDKWWR